ncbi:membrane protein [Clostridium novyi A str. 4552]|uniref:Membrane protein n=1 Tax=Clostridium novyi A str. 4552 TaxID=1444289 RepID=A0A0A0IA54_CLONO|nr:lactate utilization protein [Clostridium novyi]KGM97438.1 membrane protein [Clostridium novyi A str. 4552]
MHDSKKWYYKSRAEKVIEKLSEKKFDAVYVETLEAAKEEVLKCIKEGASVAMGGSVTLSEMDMINTIRNGDYKFFDRFDPKLTFAEEVEVYRQGMLADYFLTSTNAITEDGQLVNIDCTGNRAASMIFGPRKVIIVAGFNKIVKDLDAAMERLKKIAPMNCKRLKGHNVVPCVRFGECTDCNIKQRMCNYISIVKHGGKFEGRFKVIIVGQEVGF